MTFKFIHKFIGGSFYIARHWFWSRQISGDDILNRIGLLLWNLR
ncbi:hypothetical protein GEOBRER4_n2434 [Citrifermentans bremense]|uniref:Uncharacterized protein n=1 Tax=Citrifermentans bremense TaxID=60035 RepID=A0A7R7FT81_9BACT|nr:hypothetical protein GEOBRER4_n2434 [Citrifermentans bremense]